MLSVVCDHSLVENGQQTSDGPCGVGAVDRVGSEEVCMLPVGVPGPVIALVYRRMMRLRLYLLRSAHVRDLAVDRLLACRRACEFRTWNNIPWGKCLFLFVIPRWF